MTALLLYAYCSGLYSSRRITKACVERVDFMMIVAHDASDFRTIADFRKRHLLALGRLFLQVLKLAEKAGLVKLGHVELDGAKIKANAAKHKAMSYERMKTRRRSFAPKWIAGLKLRKQPTRKRTNSAAQAVAATKCPAGSPTNGSA